MTRIRITLEKDDSKPRAKFLVQKILSDVPKISQGTIKANFDRKLLSQYDKIRSENIKHLLLLLRNLGFGQTQEQLIKEILSGAKLANNNMSKRTAYDYAYALQFIMTYIDWNLSVLACAVLDSGLIDWVHSGYGSTAIQKKKKSTKS